MDRIWWPVWTAGIVHREQQQQILIDIIPCALWDPKLNIMENAVLIAVLNGIQLRTTSKKCGLREKAKYFQPVTTLHERNRLYIRFKKLVNLFFLLFPLCIWLSTCLSALEHSSVGHGGVILAYLGKPKRTGALKRRIESPLLKVRYNYDFWLSMSDGHSGWSW